LPRLKRLSGDDLVRIFGQFGFVVVGQRGSHAKLRRIGPHGDPQTLTVPMHRELDTGTSRALLRQATRFVDEESLRTHFYAE
jgi:predicted RNA binding protein YcfA (HicA-like mRNA interferase family)